MRSKSVAIVILLLAAPITRSQQLPELLQEVEPGLSLALQEYNSAFLREHGYFASRYRIVKADVDALLQERDLTITPFSDMQPIGLVFDRLEHYRTFWKGYYQNDPLFRATGEYYLRVGISMSAWDVDDSGTAVLTAQDKGTFYSVSATLDVPGDSKYILEPLRFTPRYSVIYEMPRDTVTAFRIDATPGDPPLSAEEQSVLNALQKFMDGLPDERDKKVLGDIR